MIPTEHRPCIQHRPCACRQTRRSRFDSRREASQCPFSETDANLCAARAYFSRQQRNAFFSVRTRGRRTSVFGAKNKHNAVHDHADEDAEDDAGNGTADDTQRTRKQGSTQSRTEQGTTQRTPERTAERTTRRTRQKTRQKKSAPWAPWTRHRRRKHPRKTTKCKQRLPEEGSIRPHRCTIEMTFFLRSIRSPRP